MSRKVAIVTGASQGIGRSTAIRLAQDFNQTIKPAVRLPFTHSKHSLLPGKFWPA